ncbi:MAG: heavy metal-associated domain-containing protein [Bdellovibrionota bacterium]
MKIVILIMMMSTTSVFAKAANLEAKMQPHATVAKNAAVQHQELKVGIKGMVCAFCAQGIEKNFLKQPEVSNVEISLENKYVKLKFKEGKSLAKEKIALILKEAGYESVFDE